MFSSRDRTLQHIAVYAMLLAALLVVGVFFVTGCPTCYNQHYKNVTFYKWTKRQFRKTPKGVLVYSSNGTNYAFLATIDHKVDKLEACFRREGIAKEIKRDCFAVYIPSDWYTSSCTGEQLVPSAADYRLCEQKGLTIPVVCRGVRAPTPECPCPCSFRAIIQDNFLIVTAPNLKLFTAELARLVTGKNNIWEHPDIVKCEREAR